MCVALARTYPFAVAGITQSYNFDSNTGLFTLTYAPTEMTLNSPKVMGVTEIYISDKYHYPNGVNVVLSPTFDSIDYRIEPNRVIVTHDYQFTQQQITVTISPK